jgi:hypothetical protein
MVRPMSIIKNRKGASFFFQLVFLCSFIIFYTGSILYLTALVSMRVNFIAGTSLALVMLGGFSYFAVKLRDRRDENEMLALDRPGYMTWDANVAMKDYLALFEKEE